MSACCVDEMLPKPLIVSLPLAPSVNHLYVTTRGGRRALSPEARAFRNETIVRVHAAQGAARRPWPKGMYHCDVTVGVHCRDMRRDLDNFLKLTQDSICAALQIDDANIFSIAALKVIIDNRDTPGILAQIRAVPCYERSLKHGGRFL